jgi:hypothetical protein
MSAPAISILFQQRLNEIAIGDFTSRYQIKAMLPVNKDTLRIFDEFKSSRPDRVDQLKALLLADRLKGRAAFRTLRSVGLLTAELGRDWYAARFKTRGLIKVLRKVGLLTTAPAIKDPCALLSSDKYVFEPISAIDRGYYRSIMGDIVRGIGRLYMMHTSDFLIHEYNHNCEMYEKDVRDTVANVFGGRLLPAWDHALTAGHIWWDGRGCIQWAIDMEEELMYSLLPLAAEEMRGVLGDREANIREYVTRTPAN